MVISSGKHDLLTNFVDVFKAANNWSKEYIWSVVCTPNGGGTGWGSKLPGVMLTNKAWGIYNGWGYYLPTKELYDSFETGDLRREATILKPGISSSFWRRTYIYKRRRCDFELPVQKVHGTIFIRQPYSNTR
jgi:hypothetical protein